MARGRLATIIGGLLVAACATRTAAAPVTITVPVSSTTSSTTTSTVAPTTTADPTSSTTTSTVAPTTTAVAPTPIEALLDQLRIEPEHDGAGYDRDRFRHWIDADHDGCSTRCEVLNDERRSDLPGLEAGWQSIYDGYTTDDPTELDIDHVVALAEAWRSGADGWDDTRRRDFANDLDEPGALVAVTAATNRSKGDKDPARWQPPNRDAWCEFGTSWARVKVKWDLSAQQAEVDALHNILRGCASTG